MKEYNVTFEITQLANNPLEAAKLVSEQLKIPNVSWVFIVQGWEDKTIYSVDLEEEDEYAVYPVDEYKPLIQ